MKVTIEATIEGKVSLDASAKVETFADLSRLARALDVKVKGVKKLMPDLAAKAIEKVRVVTE